MDQEPRPLGGPFAGHRPPFDGRKCVGVAVAGLGHMAVVCRAKPRQRPRGTPNTVRTVHDGQGDEKKLAA